MPNPVYAFLLGALTMACLVAGTFFFRFWRRTADRLFLAFGVAFLLLALNWSALLFITDNERRAAVYTLRLIAFGLIIAAIVGKNSQARRQT